MTATAHKRPSAFSFFGALLLLLVLPPFVYYLWLCLHEHAGALFVPGAETLRSLPLPTVTSVALFLGWYLFQGLLQVYAPGPWKEGMPLSDGRRLQYKMNGWFSWWFTWACVAGAIYLGWLSPTVFYDQFGPLLTTANVFSFAFVLFLYLYGKGAGRDEGTAHISGNFFYDYWMGTALNPRIRRFDFKFFCESRPGLIMWVAGNLSLAAKQYQLHGRVTVAMILVCAFHVWYIADYFFHEEAILTTWDIKHERFGFMLAWGDLVWVPFTYTIQAYYLVTHPHDLPIWGTLGIVALNIAGYLVFRGANLQKHHFRTHPERPVWGRKAEYIETAKGSLLLTSGWWGLARHINYLGDLMMGLAWCLPALFDHIVPYFYILYFTILLVHRERRDHAMCASKYGADWEAYRAKVRWRIVPGVY